MNNFVRSIFIVIAAGAILSACSGNSPLAGKLSGADSIVITFNIPNSDSVTGRVSTTQSSAIHKLSGFLDGKAMQQAACPFSGNLAFFKEGQPLLVGVFGYADDKCRYFTYSLDGKTVQVNMRNEAADFLKSLEAGKNWY